MRRQTIFKRLGKTPLEAIEIWRKSSGISEDIPIAYAGRLDPMASGKLLLLVGNECKRLKDYTGLDKEYEIQVLFGLSTDTGDLLGLIKEVVNNDVEIKEEELKLSLKSLIGNHAWEYPIFSSKTVNGKPLFQWFYEGRINEIEIPKTETLIYEAELLDFKKVSFNAVNEYVTDSISKITPVVTESKKLGSDFRRVPILQKWSEFHDRQKTMEMVLVRIRVTCGSGSYMRTFSEKLGSSLGIPACAYSIHRTRIGKYRKLGPLSFWFPEY